MKQKKAKLVGGTRNGETTLVIPLKGIYWPPLVYMTKRISLAESQELAIDDVTAWKPPEEVYVHRGNGEYYYRNTVHYKPDAMDKPE